ncbi:MAG: ABC transporter substrate-binding protein [Chloroflexota bacterium]
MKHRLLLSTLFLTLIGLSLALVQAQDDDMVSDARLDELTSVQLMLDFTPNTNHTGFYVAQANGYYEDLNLDVEILEPADILPEQAVSTGVVDFGVGFQEFSTFAMVDGADIVSIAAMIQENTSGFASLSEENTLESPADLAPLTYGGFSIPGLENAMIETLLACEDAEWDSANYQDIGFADPIELMGLNRIDFAWIFYAWQGIGAEVDDQALDVLFFSDYQDCIPNYYTPILITSGEMIDTDPDVVRAFVEATARGYEFAIEDPETSAEILLEAVPELDEALVTESALWLSERYQGEATQWGVQDPAVWEGFTAFMVENGIIPEDSIDPLAVFTNDFLPELPEDEETETDE